MVSVDEVDHIDQESTFITGVTGHSTKIHHNTYEKTSFFALKFHTWMRKFTVKGYLHSFPLVTKQNVAYYPGQHISDSDKCNTSL